MADQWYYAQQGQRQGPVAEEQLKQLASSGQLKPTDKVWKQGMAAWQAVSQIPGLFPFIASDEPPPIPSDPSPPPLPQETTPLPKTSMATKARQLMASLGGKGKAAAQLVAKQAERTKLSNVTLPGAFRALGAHVYGDGTFRADFADIYQRLDGHLAQIKTLQTPSVKAEGFAQKAKAVAKAANDTVHAQALKLKVNHAYADLGKAAYDSHGEQSGPTELVAPIVSAKARLAALDSNIRQLSESPPGQLLSLKRLAIGTTTTFGLLVAGFIIYFASRGTLASTSPDYSTSPFDQSVQKLPSCFSGHDFQRLCDALIVTRKDEFETTQQYEDRLRALTKKPLFGNLTLRSVFVFSTEPSLDQVRYDADRKKLDVTFPTEYGIVTIRSRDDYCELQLKNADHLHNSRYDKSLTLGLLNTDVDTAKDATLNLRILFLCHLVRTGSSETPYAQAIHEEPVNRYYVSAKLEEIWIYNFATGDIYAKFGANDLHLKDK
jgi:hypothetical protein